MQVQCFQAFDLILRFEFAPEMDEFCQFCLLPDWQPCRPQTGDLRFRFWRTADRFHFQPEDEKERSFIYPLPFARALRGAVHLTLATVSQNWIFVHAAVLRHPQGGLLLLPGASRMGKSTLCSHLIKRGFAYLSDEYAAVSAQGSIRSFARALSLRQGGRQRLFLAADQLGWRPQTGPERTRLILNTRYHAGASWQPRKLRSIEMMRILLENTVTARTRSQQSIAHLRALLSGVGGFESPRAEAEQVADWLETFKWPSESDSNPLPHDP